MPPRTGKRKAAGKKSAATKGNNALTPPDRLTWAGWVEMESEPAFFNVMLKDMGVCGIKVNEVWSLEDDDLAMLPQPVHALIFLFRYQATDKTKLETECPKQVWYAEQVPDFACATFALLNIVNNIPGLEMGTELRNFKKFTQDMTPRLRGDAIDDFSFVKQIHNSFARDEDLLQADLHLKDKLAKARKEQAVARAKKTKAANAAARALKSNPLESNSSPPEKNASAPGKKSSPPEKKSSRPACVSRPTPSEETVAKASRAPRSSPIDEEPAMVAPAVKSSPSAHSSKEETPKSTRTSKRNGKPTVKAEKEATSAAAPQPACSSQTKASKNPVTEPEDKSLNGKTTSKKENKSPSTTPTKINGASKVDSSDSSSGSTSSKRKGTFSDRNDEVSQTIENNMGNSSPPESKANANKKLKLNAPKKNPGSYPDADFAANTEQAASESRPRRSAREPKPRKDLRPAADEVESAEVEAQAVDEEGFHFCAYMPIGGHVWKLDGMDRFPQNMGSIGEGVDWLNIAHPALQERIAQYAAGAIEFNLMAVVHDPKVACVEALAANVKALEATEAKLTVIAEDWRELLDEDEDISALVDAQDNDLGLHSVDIARADLTERDRQALESADDLSQLLDLRKDTILQQSGLRRACEDEMYSARNDDSQAKTRRQDYTKYCEEVAGRTE